MCSLTQQHYHSTPVIIVNSSIQFSMSKIINNRKEKQIQRCFWTIDNGLGAYVHKSGSVWKQKMYFHLLQIMIPQHFFLFSDFWHLNFVILFYITMKWNAVEVLVISYNDMLSKSQFETNMTYLTRKQIQTQLAISTQFLGKTQLECF